MQTIQIQDLQGTVFPTGRRTRVIIGANSPVQADNFVMGYVELEPNGTVPMHSHENEEVYFIAEGEGSMIIGDEKQKVTGGTAIYIPSNIKHELINDSTSKMVMMFVYSPAGVVSHWAEELKNK